MLVTIDGPAGTGKSTIAKELAKRLKGEFFNTGALYRSFACFFIQSGKSKTDEALLDLLHSFHFSVKGDQFWVNHQEVTKDISSPEVASEASALSALALVRKGLLGVQRKWGQGEGIKIFEGRDMGTVVFPHAEKKFFLTATPQIRAERRWKQLQQAGVEISQEKVLEQVQERDDKDSHRSEAPLKCPEDGIVVDSTFMTFEQVLQRMTREIQE